MAEDFAGRQVVVTGGTGALGRAVVATLLERGALVHVPVFDPEELRGFEQVDALRWVTDLDLGDAAAVDGFYDALPELWASVQLVGGFSMAPLEATSSEEFERMWRLNAGTCFNCCRAAVRAMRRGGGGGRLVNVAARPALVPTGGMAAYASAKAAVAGLTLSLAEELAPEKVWVNAVVPSIMDTPANREAMPGADHAAWPDVAEVAQTIAYLLSPHNAVTRGALVPVYGRS